MSEGNSAQFAALVDELIASTNGRVVRINSTSIKTNGKMFAWLKGDRLTLKLPPGPTSSVSCLQCG